MGNRIIKESICTSEDIAKLSLGAEVLFYRLIVKADDFGVYFGNPEIIRGTCFPLNETVKPATIKKWLQELSDAGLIRTYTADGRAYLQFSKWASHQRIRNKTHKHPLPKSEECQLAADCGDSQQLAADCGLNPIQSNPESNVESNPESNPSRVRDLLQDFAGDNTELLEALRGFEEMRKKIKKPLTDRAKQMLLNKLASYPENEWIPILNQSVFESWQGIFPLKERNRSKGDTDNVFLRMYEQEHANDK